MSNLTEALIAAKLVGGSGGSGGGSGLPEIRTETEEILALQTLTFEDREGVYGTTVAGTFDIAVGDTFTVSYDGDDYEVTVFEVADRGILGFGNLSLAGMGADTGEPFFGGIMGGNGLVIIASTSDPTHEVGISSTVYNPANGSILVVDGGEWKAVPSGGGESGGGGGSTSSSLEVAISAGEGGSFSCDKTYAEILEAFDANTPIDATVFAGTHVLSKVHFYAYSASRVRFFYFAYNGTGLEVTQLELNSSDEITAEHMMISGTWGNI